MKRMLINATQAEELRMAMVDGQRLYDLNIEGPASERKKANIYKGKITRIEPSLEAAFIDYGADRHGFLPLKEISSEYFESKNDSGGKPNIRDVLKEGQDIVVQIDKEERGNKGAALTTFVSLAGRFIVLKPNKSRSGGVSRRIVGADRDLARKSLHDIEVPKDMSVILRTAGIDRSAEELSWDLENLMSVWQSILNVVLAKPSPFLIYRESNAVSRSLRDYLTNDVGEILIDDEATYKTAVEQVESFMPHNLRKLKHYEDPVPLFTRYQIETQIESAFAHSVNLPSGGSIVIDHTEALVSIDINSARATKGGDIEATALNTNLEAADEIARQLRIRDLGGLIVIDFIDMGPQKNQREVENRLRDAVRQDRARVQIGKISRFGLLEMSRQRLRPSIGESSYQTCPRCSGIGTIRSVESLALAILRIIGEEARKERTAKVIAQLPVEVATYLLNEKRDWVQGLETSNDTQVVLVANSALETPHYDIRRVRDDQTDLPENAGASYLLTDVDAEPEVPESMQERAPMEQAAVGTIKPSTPAPARQKPPSGFWVWLKALFSGDGKKPAKKKQQGRRGKGSSQGRRSRDSQQSRGRGDSRQRQSRGKAKRQPGKDDKQTAQGRKKKSKKKPQPRKAQDKSQDKSQDKTQDKAQGKSQEKRSESRPETRDSEGRDEQKRPSRNRRSRGGRRRRRSEEKPAGESAQPTQTSADSTKSDVARDKPDAPAGPPKVRTDAERVVATDQNTVPEKQTRPATDKPEAAADTPVAEKPVAEKPKPASRPRRAKKKPAEEKPSLSDTQPVKPLDIAKAEAAQPVVQAEPAPTPVEKPVEQKPATAAPDATKGGNGSDDPVEKASPEKKPDVAPKADKKPAGNRLLPWEAEAPVAEESTAKPPTDTGDKVEGS